MNTTAADIAQEIYNTSNLATTTNANYSQGTATVAMDEITVEIATKDGMALYTINADGELMHQGATILSSGINEVAHTIRENAEELHYELS